MKDEKAYIEKLARIIAHFHGSKIVVDGETVAARRGYGSFGHSSDTYSNNHWREYIQAAEAVFNVISNDIVKDLKRRFGLPHE